jgi:hypothetical protein
MSHERHGRAVRRRSACGYTRRWETKNVYSRMISHRSTVRPRHRETCASGPASAAFLRLPSGRFAVRLGIRHGRISTASGSTMLLPLRVRTACHPMRTPRLIERHDGRWSWSRNARFTVNGARQRCAGTRTCTRLASSTCLGRKKKELQANPSLRAVDM